MGVVLSIGRYGGLIVCSVLNVDSALQVYVNRLLHASIIVNGILWLFPIINSVLVQFRANNFNIHVERRLTAPLRMSMSTSQRALKDPFRNLNAAQASRQKNTISIHEVHGKVYVDQLVHTEQQKQQIAVLYDEYHPAQTSPR